MATAVGGVDGVAVLSISRPPLNPQLGATPVLHARLSERPFAAAMRLAGSYTESEVKEHSLPCQLALSLSRLRALSTPTGLPSSD